MLHPTRLMLARRGLLTAALTFTLPLAAPAQQIIRHDGGSDDRARSVATDSAGAVYVGGAVPDDAQPVGFAVVKHDAQGVLQWVARHQGQPGDLSGLANSVALDAAGNVYAAGYTFRQTSLLTIDIDWVVASFTPAGVQRWAHVIRGADNTHQAATQIVVGPGGDIFAAGTTGPANGLDWLVVRYSPDGTPRWQRTLSGTAAADDRPVDLVAGADGTVTVLGATVNTVVGGPADLTLVRFDAQGNPLWNRSYSDTALSHETPGALAADAAGNFYATGVTSGSLSAELPEVPFTLKYDGAGNALFLLMGDAAGGSAVVAAPDGNLVLAGTAVGDVGLNIRSAVTKIDPAGHQLWTTPVATAGRLAVDAAGNVFVGATRFTSGHDFFAAKLSPQGAVVWQQTYADGAVVFGTAIGANGDFLVTGDSDGGTSPDMLTLRYAAGSGPTPPALTPAAPSGLKLTAAKSKLTLQWVDNAGNETGFTVERSVNGAAFAPVAQLGANVRTYADTGLNKRTTYAYRVRAFNAAGASAYSNTASGQPK